MDTPNVDANLSEAYTALETADLGDLTEGTLHDLGRRYDLSLRLIAMATEMRNALEIALIEAMPTPTLEMDGVRITREATTRSAWKEGGAARMREDVAFGVANKLATDVGTGEVDPVRRNLMKNAINESLKVFNAPQGLKKAGREDLGLRMGEYKTYSPGHTLRVATPMEDEG